MKEYFVLLKFAYKDDVKNYGEPLTDEDLKNKNYNKVYCRSYTVQERNKNTAIARAMEKANADGWCSGNYLYVIDVKVEK